MVVIKKIPAMETKVVIGGLGLSLGLGFSVKGWRGGEGVKG